MHRSVSPPRNFDSANPASHTFCITRRILPPCSIYRCAQKQRPRHRYVYFKYPASCVQWSTHRQALWRGDFQPIVINHNLNARIVVAAMHYRVDNQLANGIRQNPIYVLPVHTLEPGTHMNVAQHILVELFDKLLPRRVITNVIGTPLSRANERNQHQYHGAHRQLQRLR